MGPNVSRNEQEDVQFDHQCFAAPTNTYRRGLLQLGGLQFCRGPKMYRPTRSEWRRPGVVVDAYDAGAMHQFVPEPRQSSFRFTHWHLRPSCDARGWLTSAVGPPPGVRC